jgi:hypothetical protein
MIGYPSAKVSVMRQYQRAFVTLSAGPAQVKTSRRCQNRYNRREWVAIVILICKVTDGNIVCPIDT